VQQSQQTGKFKYFAASSQSSKSLESPVSAFKV